MAENLREVIARRLANSQPSETPTPAPVPKVKEAEVVKDDEDFDDEIEEVPATKEIPTNDKKVEENDQQTQMEAIYREMEMLQNDGRFRAELLHQLNEINKSLSVVSDAIIDLVKPND